MDLTRQCRHETELLDDREGHYVCLLCGLVLDEFFYDPNLTFQKSNPFVSQKLIDKSDHWLGDVCDILDKINLPQRFGFDIIHHFNTCHQTKNRKNLLASIYYVLNHKLGVCLTLAEISNVVGCCKKEIRNQQRPETLNVSVDKDVLTEKYCSMLELDFKTTSLIKEEISKIKKAGHSPTTIVAGSIYLICKRLKLKKTIKNVSDVTSVSAISIQRFVKYVYSQR